MCAAFNPLETAAFAIVCYVALFIDSGRAYIKGMPFPSQISEDYRPQRVFRTQGSERKWLRILDLGFNGYGIFGLADQVLNLSFSSMTGTYLDFHKSETNRKYCSYVTQSLKLPRSQCEINYVRTLFRLTKKKYWLYGTGGGASGVCRKESYNDDNGQWSVSGSCDMRKTHYSTMAPPLPFVNLTTLKASDGYFYAGGMAMKVSGLVRYGVFKARPAISDGNTTPALYSTLKPTGVYYLQVDIGLGNIQASRIYPNFVQSFETTFEVYWVFSESALETEPFIHRKVSRVGRVCKNDNSVLWDFHEDVWDKTKPFMTYWKATLDCSLPRQYGHNKENTYTTVGQHKFSFNIVAASTRLNNGSVYVQKKGKAATKEILYAVFNTDRNSIFGSAVCAYEKAALEAPFSGPLWELKPPEADLGRNKLAKSWSWQQTNFINRPYAHPANCQSKMRSPLSAQTLLDMVVSPVSGQPLLFLTSHHSFLSTIEVDWQVRALDGHYYDVLFVGTEDGNILKIVNVAGPQEINFQIIERRRVSSTETAGVAELQLIRDMSVSSTVKKTLVVNTFDAIYSVPVENCGSVSTCESCVALLDPYCAWNTIGQLCTAVTYGQTKAVYLQNIRSGKHSGCGESAGLQSERSAPMTVGLRTGVLAAGALAAAVLIVCIACWVMPRVAGTCPFSKGDHSEPNNELDQNNPGAADGHTDKPINSSDQQAYSSGEPRAMNAPGSPPASLSAAVKE